MSTPAPRLSPIAHGTVAGVAVIRQQFTEREQRVFLHEFAYRDLHEAMQLAGYPRCYKRLADIAERLHA